MCISSFEYNIRTLEVGCVDYIEYVSIMDE